VSPFLVELLTRAIRNRADVYHCNDIDTLPAGAIAARLVKARYVFDAHELYADESEAMTETERAQRDFVLRKYLPGAAGFTTVSRGIADVYEASYGRRPIVVRNVPEIVGDVVSAPDAGAASRVVLFYHSMNLDWSRRGPEDCVRALALLPERVRLVFMGRPSESFTRGLAQLDDDTRGRLRDRIEVRPLVAQEQVVREAARAHIGLQPDRPTCSNQALGLPNKLFEYMMAGLALAVSDKPGHREVLTSENAVFFTPGDPASIASSVQQLLDSPAVLSSMRSQNRKLAVEEYNWDRERERLVGMYRTIAEK